MTKEKWLQIYSLEADKFCSKLSSKCFSVKTWNEEKQIFLDFVKAMDEATEVYNMENKGE